MNFYYNADNKNQIQIQICLVGKKARYVFRESAAAIAAARGREPYNVEK